MAEKIAGSRSIEPGIERERERRRLAPTRGPWVSLPSGGVRLVQAKGWLEPPKSEALEAQDALRGRPPEGKLTRGPANRKAASQPPFLFVRTPGPPVASYRFTPLPPPAPTAS